MGTSLDVGSEFSREGAMSDSERPGETPRGGIGQRKAALIEAIAAAPDEMAASIGLPNRVERGEFAFTYMADPWGNNEPLAIDVEFEWSGGRTANWTRDISIHEAVTPASSAPVHGWASWLNGTDLLLAFSSEDLEMEGWARVPGRAPTANRDGDEDDEDEADEEQGDDDEEMLADPARWIAMARTIESVISDVELPGMTGERYGEE